MNDRKITFYVTSANTHQQQAAGNEVVDEIPQESRKPVGKDIDPTQKLDVLCLSDSLRHCLEAKASDYNSHVKSQI